MTALALGAPAVVRRAAGVVADAVRDDHQPRASGRRTHRCPARAGLRGLELGFKLWERNPLTGVGPGAWRPATRSKIESHNLYGQLVGELGALGLVAFLAILAGFWLNLRRIAAIRKRVPGVGERPRLPGRLGGRDGGVPAAVHGQLRAQPVPL